jgi:sodium-dependent dicarboxylate transporter 2/3/5
VSSVDKSSAREHPELGHEIEEVVIDTRPIAVVLLSKSMRPVILIFGAILFAILLRATPPTGLSEAAERALAVFALAAVYWITGVLPLMVTSLLVIVLLGVSGVMPARAAYALFGNESIFFILAAFMLAAAVNHRGLGRRVALEVFGRFGTTPRSLVLSVYLLSALMSFVIPEHAVAAMVFPIVLDIVAVMELRPGDSRYATALFLAMAWGVNIGGIATLLGGARGPLALGILAEATNHSISFLQWTAATLPLVGLLIVAGYVVIIWWFAPDLESIAKVTSELGRRRSALGRMTLEETAVALVLGATVLAWLLGSQTYGYAGIAILAVVAPFVFNLLTWREVEEYVNWGIVLMYGGAIALGSALEKTGAAQFIARTTVGRGKSPLLILVILTLASEVLGELLSHSAVVAALVPVGLGIARQFGFDPATMTMSVAVPAGLTFILPVGTPSIALAYSSGFLRRKDLLAPGALMIVIAWIGLNVMIQMYWPIIGLGVAAPR